MNLEQYAYLSQIVGMIVVIASLIYVARQVRQNTDAQLAASRQAALAADMTLVAATIANPEAAGNFAKPFADLTFAEQTQMGNVIAGFVRTREFAWAQYRHGVMDKDTMNSYMGTLIWWIQLGEAGRYYWSMYSQYIDPKFVSYVDALLAKQSAA